MSEKYEIGRKKAQQTLLKMIPVQKQRNRFLAYFLYWFRGGGVTQSVRVQLWTNTSSLFSFNCFSSVTEKQAWTWIPCFYGDDQRSGKLSPSIHRFSFFKQKYWSDWNVLWLQPLNEKSFLCWTRWTKCFWFRRFTTLIIKIIVLIETEFTWNLFWLRTKYDDMILSLLNVVEHLQELLKRLPDF